MWRAITQSLDRFHRRLEEGFSRIAVPAPCLDVNLAADFELAASDVVRHRIGRRLRVHPFEVHVQGPRRLALLLVRGGAAEHRGGDNDVVRPEAQAFGGRGFHVAAVDAHGHAQARRGERRVLERRARFDEHVLQRPGAVLDGTQARVADQEDHAGRELQVPGMQHSTRQPRHIVADQLEFDSAHRRVAHGINTRFPSTNLALKHEHRPQRMHRAARRNGSTRPRVGATFVLGLHHAGQQPEPAPHRRFIQRACVVIGSHRVALFDERVQRGRKRRCIGC